MEYVEDILETWEKRIQFESILFFFFTVVAGSSYVSIFMFSFYSEDIWNLLPAIAILYFIAMLCWWYVCKRMTFNSSNKSNKLLTVNGIAIISYEIITLFILIAPNNVFSEGRGASDLNSGVDIIFRAVNCFLVTAYIGTLTYDYIYKLQSRIVRLKLWFSYLLVFGIVSTIYFGYLLGKDNGSDYVVGLYLATIGAGLLAFISLIALFLNTIYRYIVAIVFLAITGYWWGSASLHCYDYYSSISNIVVPPAYQMLWTVAVVILLESLPMTASNVSVFGAVLLVDEEGAENAPSSQVNMGNIVVNSNNNNNPNIAAYSTGVTTTQY